jgi:nesprin-1
LEVGLVRWKEWEDQYREAEEWLSKTEEQVKSFNKLQNSLTEKKNALEQFQAQLQTIFDWQKELDKLNLKAQLLLETCADSRVSNAVTQISTKFSALLSLAKEVIRRLEQQYQEHQQHSALYQECQDWIDRTREKLNHISDLNYNLSDVNSRLQSVKGLKQTLEQGQNKLRYALELKEKVMLATEPSGASKIDEDTELLKTEFDKLMSDIQDTRQKLAARASLLEELDKADKLIQDWLQEIELKMNVSEGNQYVDLSEKRSSLEKLRGIEKEVVAQYDLLQRLEKKMGEDPNMPKEPYMPTFVRYEYIKSNLISHTKRLEGIVKEHEDYLKQFNETTDFLRKLRLELERFSDTTHSQKSQVENKLLELSGFSDSFLQADGLVKGTRELASVVAQNATSVDGKDAISQECHQLQFELDTLSALLKDQQKSLKKRLDSWNDFEKALESTKLIISSCELKLKAEPSEIDKATPDDLERVKVSFIYLISNNYIIIDDNFCSIKKLLAEVSAIKMPLEDLSDKCENLMELGAAPSVRESAAQLQAQYIQLLAGAQAMLVNIQKSLSDHTDFLKEKQELEEWLDRAEGTLQDSTGFGTEAVIREKLETCLIVSTRLTEGQHLLTILQDSFTRVIGLIPSEQQAPLRDDVAALQTRWETLNMDLKNTLSDLKQACQRWDDFKDNCLKFTSWCKTMEDTLREKPTHKAELGDMKTVLERYKNLDADIQAQKTELERLDGEADQLVMWSGTESVKEPINAFKQRWNQFENKVKEAQRKLENEIEKYSDFHNSLQETEKWLLQTSFQLMAHNSLYITNREQTLEQLALHEALLEEIQSYQETLEEVKTKGRGQIDRYVQDYPQLQTTIEKQLKNVQDSYDSLLHTGLQIKKRLLESLSKFQEYEDALESIMQNLDKWEPEIEETLEAPIENIGASSKRLEYIRVCHET